MILESNGTLYEVLRTVKKSSIKKEDKGLLKEWVEVLGGDHALENNDKIFIVRTVKDVEFEEINTDNNEEGIPVLERGMESESEQSNNE